MTANKQHWQPVKIIYEMPPMMALHYEMVKKDNIELRNEVADLKMKLAVYEKFASETFSELLQVNAELRAEIERQWRIINGESQRSE